MKRLLILPVLAVGALVLASAGLAGHGHGNGKDKGKHAGNAVKGKLSMTVVTTERGSCQQNPWATSTLQRTYKVKRNEDGSYRVGRKDKGTFVTTGPVSPGACQADPKHGQVLAPGYTGKVHGYLKGTVTGGTFNPNGTCTAECSGPDFIAAFFTPGAQFTCSNGYAGCKYAYKYTAQRQNTQQSTPLLYHRWAKKSVDGATEVTKGDIATG